MRSVVKKWGNSASVRLPAAIMDAARLNLDEAVDITEDNGRIIITPIRPSGFDLDLMLAAITPDNLHAETNFGPAVGNEAL